MAAPTPSGHPIIDQPTTAADCLAEYKAAHLPDADNRPGQARTQLGALGTGQQRTYR